MPFAPFRVAEPASEARNLAKTALQVVVIWTTTLYFAPLGIVALESRLGPTRLARAPLVGWLALIAFSAFGLWSGYVMATRGRGTPLPLDTARELVIAGPYRVVRNPMAVAGLGQGLGVALMFGSLGVALYVLAGGVLWNFVVRPIEEADLERRFGDAFRAYRRAVPCWRPSWPPYRRDGI
jgi:protein-S-isoprenylcysteine O-methyltransferase Ste14